MWAHSEVGHRKSDEGAPALLTNVSERRSLERRLCEIEPGGSCLSPAIVYRMDPGILQAADTNARFQQVNFILKEELMATDLPCS